MSAKLFLILKDGERMEMRTTDSVGTLLHRIKTHDVETIVAGDVEDNRVLWEKQFIAGDVMPSGFGKPVGG